ncbi:alpha-hydroxy-acid oxidizing protein (plasmid) [Paracoccus versutus]|uniref:4-hydroxymandelate oxidase n=1 Tax=Paracoccus versutus TaxID=34007 RepID=A0AAQ0KP68_PARVE|nr:alpha-hydroxy acid oxidase [Paracoccus versutus]KGJ10135.1 glycolate oxidase [Paracoccus versutus]REG55887.1 4-hydroxymandelate oxidase [Paracoccus versutus]WEJ81495.1 alpha-hydroxy-acid oxidizing protein [Paracoccus versutus]
MAGQAEIPADVVALCDYERHAAERMPAPLRAYVDGAGADGLTAQANLAAWQAIRLQGRVLADLRGADTGLRLLGLDLPHPLILAPVAFHGLAHAEAEHATALGAAATGSLMVVSTQSGLPLEDIAARAQGPLWFQLYMQPERGDTLSLVRRAEAAGCRALVVSVDAPVNGLRNMEQRAGFRLPEGIRAVNLDGMRPPQIRSEPGRAATFLGLMDAAPRWEDIAWLKSQTRLPLLLKGIMSAHDAERAVAVGVDGVIVSNHGGRALDTLPATAEALPVVARQVAGRIPVLCDGGIRRGTDALKALALGASAVLVGRPQIHALAVGGAAGVAHMLTILRAELEVAMALTGRRDLAGIDETVLWGS